MQCADVRQQMATYRELDEAERFLVYDHLDTCAECRAAFEAYQAQDRRLVGLPTLTPSPRLTNAVLARTTRRPAPRPAAPRPSSVALRPWARSLAVAALALVVISVSTLGVAAGSLPGDALYGVKRASERVRLALMMSDAGRSRYLAQLAVERRAEVRAAISEGREVEVEFEGRLQATGDQMWTVDGIAVQFDGGTLVAVDDAARWREDPPVSDEVLLIRAQVSGGRVTAQRVRIATPVVDPTGEPAVRPTRTHTPPPTLTATIAPTTTPTALPPSRTPTGVRPGPSAERTRAPLSERTRTPLPERTRPVATRTPLPERTRPAASRTPAPATVTRAPRATLTPRWTPPTAVPTRPQSPTPRVEPTRPKPTRQPTRVEPTRRPTHAAPTPKPNPTDAPPTPKPLPTDPPAWPTPKPQPTAWPTPRLPTPRPFPTANKAPGK